MNPSLLSSSSTPTASSLSPSNYHNHHHQNQHHHQRCWWNYRFCSVRVALVMIVGSIAMCSVIMEWKMYFQVLLANPGATTTGSSIDGLPVSLLNTLPFNNNNGAPVSSFEAAQKQQIQKDKEELEKAKAEFEQQKIELAKKEAAFELKMKQQQQQSTSNAHTTSITTVNQQQQQVGGENVANNNNIDNNNNKVLASTAVQQQQQQSQSQLQEENVEYPNINCGCPHSCTVRALRKGNAAYTSCGFRITKLMDRYKMSQIDACVAASSNDGEPCEMDCNPRLCHNLPKSDSLQYNISDVDIHDPPFIKYDKVVIVTKTHNPAVNALKQMFCLLKAAYNRHVNYDILVFSTIPWNEQQINEMKQIVAPANFYVAQDGYSTVDEHLATMTNDEIEFLKKRCDVEPGTNLTWFHYCHEEGYRTNSNLAYAWQSEFRTRHIWTHPALKNYKYMIWMDSDALCTQTWNIDPMKVMIDNDLVLLYDNFPQGGTKKKQLKQMMMDAYNKTICKVKLTKDGQFHSIPCDNPDDDNIKIHHVHGFHHITNLDFYRQPSNIQFLTNMISQYKFSRMWDDQLGVTTPAAILAPNKSWDMRLHGIYQGIHHNGEIDGKEKNYKHNYRAYWNDGGKQKWIAGRAMCDGLITQAG